MRRDWRKVISISITRWPSICTGSRSRPRGSSRAVNSSKMVSERCERKLSANRTHQRVPQCHPSSPRLSLSATWQLQRHIGWLEPHGGSALVLECSGESTGDSALSGTFPALSDRQWLCHQAYSSHWVQLGRRGGWLCGQTVAGVGHQADKDNGTGSGIATLRGQQLESSFEPERCALCGCHSYRWWHLG